MVRNPSSNKEWKDDFIFMCGDNWEGLSWEKDNNFISVPENGACFRPPVCVCSFVCRIFYRVFW